MIESVWQWLTIAAVVLLMAHWGLTTTIMTLFFVAFVATRAIAPVAVLAVVALLFPQAAGFAGPLDLLLLAILGSTISTLVVDWLGLEMAVRRALAGPVPPLHGWSRIVAVAVEGLTTAASLVLVARFLDQELLAKVPQLFPEPGVLTAVPSLAPEAGLSVIAALVAGLISSFTFYYLGLRLNYALGDAGESPTDSLSGTAAEKAALQEEDPADTPERRHSGKVPILLLVLLVGWVSQRLAAPEWVAIVMTAATATAGAWVFLPLILERRRREKYG